MKQILVVAATLAIVACSSNSSDKKDDVSEKSENQPGIQNVNGNIPDTTNAINLDKSKTDSSNNLDSTAHPNTPD